MKKILCAAGIISALVLTVLCKTPPQEPVETPVIIKTPVPTPVPTAVPTPSPERPYYIEVIPPKVKKNYRINPYSFVHSFYSFIFHDFDLTSLIPLDERKDIMKIIYNEIQPGSQVNFVIKKYLNVDKLSFVFFAVPDEDALTLHLKTNYDKGAGVLIPLDMPKEQWKRCVSIFYYIIDSRLVHRDDLYSLYKEDELTEARQYMDLAHLYIFDENIENDEHVETILSNIIERNASNTTSLLASCELASFYLLNRRVSDAESVITRAVPLLEGPKLNKIRKNYDLLTEKLEILKWITDSNSQ